MPNQPPSDRTRAKGVPPLYLTLTEVGDIRQHPKMRNEPNLPPDNFPLPPVYAKRTQFRPPTTRPKIQIRETNPISAYPASRCPLFLRNEPNLPPRHHRPTPQMRKTNPISASPPPSADPKMRNEPNLPHRQLRTATFSAKRTQFPPLAIPTRREPVRKPNGISHLYILAYSRANCYDSSEFHSSLINHGYLRWK